MTILHVCDCGWGLYPDCVYIIRMTILPVCDCGLVGGSTLTVYI